MARVLTPTSGGTVDETPLGKRPGSEHPRFVQPSRSIVGLAIAMAVCAACKRAPPAPSATAPSATASSASGSPAVAASSHAPAVPTDPHQVLDAWNDAHARHDADALERLYAPQVLFYGTATTAADAAAKKRAAFATSPGYTQAVEKPVFEKTADGKETWARFDKVTKDRGAKRTYPMLMRFDASGRIIEESDDVTRDEQWCIAGTGGEMAPSERVVPPFRISAAGAEQAAMASRHLQKLRKTTPGVIVGSHGLAFGFGCAKRCAVRADDDDPLGNECDFRFRVDDGDAHTQSNLVEWLDVDPMTKTLHWEVFDGDGGSHWESEVLK